MDINSQPIVFDLMHQAFVKVKVRSIIDFDVYIGKIEKVDPDLGIGQVTFTNSKTNTVETHWFSMFSGQVVDLPKGRGKKNKTPTITNDPEKLKYILSNDPISFEDRYSNQLAERRRNAIVEEVGRKIAEMNNKNEEEQHEEEEAHISSNLKEIN